MPADPTQLISVNEFLGDGSRIIWSFAFAGGYLHRDHVAAELIFSDGNYQAIEFAWVDDSTVRIEPAVAAGQRFRIFRNTPRNKPLLDFSDGAFLTEGNLDTNAKQAVFIAAEAVDRGEGSLAQIAPRAILVPWGEVAPAFPPRDQMRGKLVGVDLAGRLVGITLDPQGRPILDAEFIEFEGETLADRLRRTIEQLAVSIADLERQAVAIVDNATSTRALEDRLAQLRLDHAGLVALIEAMGNISEEGVATLIRTEKSERLDGDTALAAVLAVIGASSDGNTAFIINLDQVKVSPTESLAERFANITARTDAAFSQIVDERSTRTNAFEAEALARTTLGATLRNEISSAVESERIARADAVSAEARSRDNLAAVLRGETDNKITAAVQDERTARVTAVEAEATARTQLSATLRGEFGGQVQEEARTRADADGVFTQQFLLLGAQTPNGSAFQLNMNSVLVTGGVALGTHLSGINTRVAGAEAAVAEEARSRASAVEAVANRVTQLEATSGNTADSYARAQVTEERQARTDAVSALSTSITTLNTRYNDVSASVSVHAQALSTLDGRTSTYWQVSAVDGNGRSKLRVHTENGGGVDIEGDVSIQGNLLVSGSVNTREIANDAISATTFATLPSQVRMFRNNESMVLTVSVPNVVAGELLRVVGAFSLYSDNDLTGTVIVRHHRPDGGVVDIRRQGMKLDSDGDTATYLTLPVIARVIAEQSGTHTFQLGYLPTANASFFYAQAGTDLEITRQKR